MVAWDEMRLELIERFNDLEHFLDVRARAAECETHELGDPIQDWLQMLRALGST